MAKKTKQPKKQGAAAAGLRPIGGARKAARKKASKANRQKDEAGRAQQAGKAAKPSRKQPKAAQKPKKQAARAAGGAGGVAARGKKQVGKAKATKRHRPAGCGPPAAAAGAASPLEPKAKRRKLKHAAGEIAGCFQLLPLI